MRYLDEFRANGRLLAAAALGMGSGYTINNYLTNIFLPPLVREFGWSKSSAALIGASAALSIIFQPIAGRLTDRFGVRPVAAIGIASAPILYVLFSLMRGAFWEFLVLNLLLVAVVAAATGAVVYTRLIAQAFVHARGMALALAVCAPSLVGAIVAPSFSAFIDQHGWRRGYVAAAVGVAIAGILTLLLIPKGSAGPAAPSAAPETAAPPGPGVPLYRSPAFFIIVAGMALCSLSVAFQTSQLKLAILGLGFDSATATAFISTYAVGVIFGRLLSGVALDALPAHAVAAVALTLPGIGLLIFATAPTSPVLVGIAVLLLGLSLGAEGDVAGYLVTRYFDLTVYSTVLGFVFGAIALSSAVGAVLLSGSLRLGGSMTPFLFGSGIAAFVGGSLFWLLRGLPVARHAAK